MKHRMTDGYIKVTITISSANSLTTVHTK